MPSCLGVLVKIFKAGALFALWFKCVTLTSWV